MNKNRNLFDMGALEAIKKVFEFYGEADFGYQGEFEKRYTDDFIQYQGGEGYADAVCSGTAALYIAIASLQIAEGSHVMVSPITDPGTINAIILNRLIPVIVDSMSGSYNIGLEQVIERVTPKTKAIVVVHAGGKAAPIAEITEEMQKRGIKVIEDCSQAHGAEYKGRKVGTFGEIAAFSTMYRKNHATGGCGGVVYTKNQELYRLARANADRGKPFFDNDYNEKNPATFLFPALNLNQDELSCALGSYTLSKLDATRQKRLKFLEELDSLLKHNNSVCSLMPFSNSDSPFFWQVFVDRRKAGCSAKLFGEKLAKLGIGINPHYDYILTEWDWSKKFYSDNFVPVNAIMCINNSFNLLFHEKHDSIYIKKIMKGILSIHHESTP